MVRRRLTPDVLGVLVSAGAGAWAIVVNEAAGPDEAAWTIAHELGHYVLHQEKR